MRGPLCVTLRRMHRILTSELRTRLRSFRVHGVGTRSLESIPSVLLAHMPLAGFCALDTRLPLRQEAEMQLIIPAVMKNGLNAPFNRLVHCVAAEPRATFLRIAVTSGMQEVAYEVGVLARLRCGYRVFQLR
jgi:hypothetical protein